MLHKYLVGSYAPYVDQALLTDTTFQTPIFAVVAGLLALGLLYIGLTTLVSDRLFSIPGIVLASILMTVAIWMEKVLFVYEGLVHPTNPPLTNLYPHGIYDPTIVELVITMGSVVLAALLFAIATKIIPMVELDTEVNE